MSCHDKFPSVFVRSHPNLYFDAYAVIIPCAWAGVNRFFSLLRGANFWAKPRPSGFYAMKRCTQARPARRRSRREVRVGFWGCSRAEASGDAGVRVRLDDGVRQEADAEARAHELHRHGRCQHWQGMARPAAGGNPSSDNRCSPRDRPSAAAIGPRSRSMGTASSPARGGRR